LQPGKLADFIVLDRYILRCPAEDIRETKVLETWLGGKRNNEPRLSESKNAL
jgi:predicted amidohydrolase YtcJ